MPGPDPPLAASTRGVSLRAIGMGIFCCLAIAVGEPYGVLMMQSSPMAADYSTGAALFLFFIVTLLINPVARLLTGTALRPGELATVYIMLIVGTAIPSWGLSMNLIPLLGGFLYYATPENDWAALILPYLEPALILNDAEAVQKLFEGRGQGEPIPWGTWMGPLFYWSLFILTTYFVTLCLLVVLRRQWVDRERLTFPLATLPLQMSADTGGRLLPPFLRNYMTWIGFCIPAIIGSINALHRYYNFIPWIDLNVYVPILRRSLWLNLKPHFEVIGLSYLLNLDVSLGIWLFALLNMIAMGALRMMGWTIGLEQPYSSPAPPSIAHFALGALFFLVFSTFWQGREHIKAVVRKAFGRQPDLDDSNELLPYRVAVFGILIGISAGMIWLVLAGMNVATALVFQLSALVIFTGLSRIISQAGLAYCRAPVAPAVFTVNTLGSSFVGASGITTLALNFPWSADIRTFVMASAATGLKLAEVMRLEYRRLFGAIVVAILVTMAGSGAVVIYLGYTHGGINLASWQFGHMTTYTGNWITHNISNPAPVQTWHLAFTGAGGLLMALLTFLKNRFVGFPIHPIGLAVGLPHPVQIIWPSVFFAWLLKAVILKYGGPILYTRLRPFFLGLVLGAFGIAGIWLIIDSITGMTGNRLISIG
ncbi:MAG: DUF6785 family protein [Candidatus Latescibacterota bacterium]|nr:DUF6785 family protein [Candidatus Latescibacterota bacterium]